jgi:hypothetical protein
MSKSKKLSDASQKVSDTFYIGWMPRAPKPLAKYIRWIAIGLAVLVVMTSALLALRQKKFSTASFEFGQLTEVHGIYQQFPVPSIKVMTAQDAFGHTTYITMPLVGYGKFGAEGTISQLEKERKTSLDNREVTFKGTLLYSDGKTLLQVDSHDDPLINIGALSKNGLAHEIKELGTVQLTGEVLDPKCYFGVMKPGHGKPHRDCAIRCIEGGMSPVFYVRNEAGEANYYLILDANGEKMNEDLKDHISEPISLQARAVQFDDWVILYVDGKDKIKRTGGLSWFKDETISCRPGH